MSELEVFISHKSEDCKIAAYLKKALLRLSINRLKIHVCEEIQGGSDWRDWIKEKISRSKGFIFLYTDSEADWGWCNYELGLFNGKNNSSRNRVLCIKHPDIDLPTTLEHCQAYDADRKGIEKFFDDLIYQKAISEEVLNPDLHTEYKDDLISHSEKTIKFFTSLVNTEFFAQRIEVELSEVAGDEIKTLDIDEARIKGNKPTMRLLGLTGERASWKNLQAVLRARDQDAWLGHLRKAIDEMKNGLPPKDILPPLQAYNGETVFPIISRVEFFRDRSRSDILAKRLKRLFVIFIPMLKTLEEAYTLKDMRDLIGKWVTYPPSSVVRIKWQGRSRGLAYAVDDMEGPPVVCAINPAFAQLFDITFQQLPDPDGKQPLTSVKLMENIKNYMSPSHFDALGKDQQRVNDRIVFKNKDALATVPLQFNDQHPFHRDESYLPYLICKHVIGKTAGPHATYLLICYIKDFWPLDHPESPFYPKAGGTEG
ncbi:MAG: toll/interleukin-1 receptor domain-containing protein [Desulfosarcina sp.]|nr:toll/interleukin-1 receptor domain-containing protein [Desulfobacterales bacterium]